MDRISAISKNFWKKIWGIFQRNKHNIKKFLEKKQALFRQNSNNTKKNLEKIWRLFFTIKRNKVLRQSDSKNNKDIKAKRYKYKKGNKGNQDNKTIKIDEATTEQHNKRNKIQNKTAYRIQQYIE